MRTAIVTGGSKGIGLGIARAIVRDGGRVMIGGRDGARVEAAVRSLADAARNPTRAAGRALDVRDRASVDAFVAAAVEQFGGFDVLVNNAGTGAFGNVETLSDADWSRVIDTNLTGVFYCTHAALPHLKASGEGWVVNIASLAARNYFPGGAAYCASKAGLVAFSESLMQEVRFDNIRVTVIMPGSVATEFSGPSEHHDDSWMLTPDDVAEAVVDLLRHPPRSLPSKVEIRPAKPKK